MATLILALIVSFSRCNKSNLQSDIPVYSYQTPPTSDSVPIPPVFQIVYNISTYGDKVAILTFDSSAVWLIEKLGDGRINYFAINDSTTLNIFKADTLGLAADSVYRFVANNNNYTEFNNFFTQFTRLNIDYDTFEPKF